MHVYLPSYHVGVLNNKYEDVLHEKNGYCVAWNTNIVFLWIK